MVRVVLASIATGSIDSSLLLHFFFHPSALVLLIYRPSSHLQQAGFLHLLGVADIEMHRPHPPFRQDLLPAAGNAISQQPPAVRYLTCRKPPHLRSHLSHGGMHLVTYWVWTATWGPCRSSVGFIHSRDPCQVGWGFAKPALQSTMYLFHSSYRGWTLINTCTPNSIVVCLQRTSLK